MLTTMENNEELRYLVRIGTKTEGPYSIEALETLGLNGTISPSTLVAQEGSPDFKTLDTWAFFKQIFPAKAWELAKAPSTFARVNATPEAPGNLQDWTLRVTAGPAQANPSSPTEKAKSTMARRGKPIDSMKEWEARIAADPNEPMVVASMNEIGLRMQSDGVTRKQALKQFFEANRKLNKESDQRAKFARLGETPARFRRTAAKYAVVLAAGCAGLIYYYPAARPNGQTALALIGAIYGVCFIAARWIVDMHRSAYYLMTALQLYVFGWSIWVIINVIRAGSVGDPFLALFNCLTHWHL
jgi:hypothetical protein